MAKRPFKKYNSNDSVNAVQVTKENIVELADLLGGEYNENTQSGDPEILLPGIPSALQADETDWIVQQENGRLAVFLDEDFRENYKVPKAGTDEVETSETEE